MKTVVSPRYTETETFIKSLPTLVDKGEGEVVYNGRNKVVRFCHNQKSFVVKRYKQANVIQQIAYTFFRKSKAARAYLFAYEFQRRGIDTPTPVAYMEKRSHGLFSTGYFVSSEAEGTETSLLLRDVEDYPCDLAQAVAQQVVLMHSRGILHGDLNLSNFLCKKSDDGYHFTMIDTNRSHFCDGFPSEASCLKNMVRLTHRRDLYEDLIRRYAILREWDVETTVTKALRLLEHFENRRIKL